MAIKSLATLIKLQKTLVDEQRLQVVRLQEYVAGIDSRIAEVEIRKAREQDLAQDHTLRTTYSGFLKSIVLETLALEKERRVAVQALQLAQEKLSELFEEQKRYEIAEEQRIEAAAREESRRERINLDEIGSVVHERKRNEDR